jgi:hypothetical protein
MALKKIFILILTVFLFKSIFGIAPDFNQTGLSVIIEMTHSHFEKINDGFHVSWPEHPYNLLIFSNEENYQIIEGQINPLQGWYFPDFNQVKKCPVLILTQSGKNCHFKSRIKICRYKENYKLSWKSKKRSDLLFDKLSGLAVIKPEHLSSPGKWRPARK